ncbi:MAG: hypothetical protein ACPGN3_09420 [Opitutales bacterium]
MISFLFLLIVAFVSVIRSDSESLEKERGYVEAKQNAVLGLRVALGELQKNLGPDQRISATADMDLNGSLDATKSRTVGVWSSVNDETLGVSEGELLAWLASDAIDPTTGDYDLNYDGNSVVAGDAAVTLLGTGSLSDSGTDGLQNDIVVVDKTATELLDESGNVSGRYAWWVGDEGIKARVNLEPLDLDSQGNDELERLEGSLQVNSFGISNIYSLSTVFEQLDLSSYGSRISNLDSIDLLANNTSTTKPFFHDLTPYSAGVLANVQTGTLKRDLSLAFELTDANFNESDFGANGTSPVNAPGFGAVQPIFQFQDGDPAFPGYQSFAGTAHGPVWHLLRDYYLLYQEMDMVMSNPTLNARVFTPNSNHETAPSPDDLAYNQGNQTWIDQQPALVMGGGKAKLLNHSYGGPLPDRLWNSNYDDFENYGDGNNVLDMVAHPNDAMRQGESGDPLRGKGLTGSGGTTMPVMVTANYMPYVSRLLVEYGAYPRSFELNQEVITNSSTDPVTTETMDLFRFGLSMRSSAVMHNPYNVSISHDSIYVDFYGAEAQLRYYDADGNIPDLVYYDDDDGTYSLLTNPSNSQLSSESLHEAYRRFNTGVGTFGPGETVTLGGFHPDEGQNYVSPRAEDDDIAEFLNPKSNTTNAATSSSIFLQVPGTGDGTDDLSTLVRLFGNKMWSPLVGSSYNETRSYSVSTAFLATHLKQPSSQSLPNSYRSPIRDIMPMASAVDTSLLFPGPTYGSGDLFTDGHTRFYAGLDDEEIGVAFTPASMAIFPHQEDRTGGSSGATQNIPYSFPVGSFELRLKPTELIVNEASSGIAASQRFPAYTHSNPLAPVRHSKNLLPQGDVPSTTTAGFTKLPADMVSMWRMSDSFSFFGANMNGWGGSDGFSNPGASNPVLIELPTSPVLSLGKLQHANLSVLAHMPALAIGNSFASPYIDPEDTYTMYKNAYDEERIFYDLSYGLNSALWDDTFFSSISVPYDKTEDNYKSSLTVQDTFEAAFEGSSPTGLPNPRIELVLGTGETLDDVKLKLFESRESRPETSPGPEAFGTNDAGYERVAENLLVKGTLNINSMSVNAWKAVLSGARGLDIYGGGVSGVAFESGDDTPLTRLSNPLSGKANGVSSDEETWNGFRALSDAQITSLASAIVDEVQLRAASRGYPFVSLASFVNRELSNSYTGRGGVIQAAIDRSGINVSLRTSFDEIDSSTLSNTFAGAFPHPDNILLASSSDNSATSNVAAPTHLSQADVLQAIGSFIGVRSDTFRIRSYGEAVNPETGEVTNKVWVEAVVQRTPEPVAEDGVFTASDQAYWEPGEFGRSFRIISIREIPESDV